MRKLALLLSLFILANSAAAQKLQATSATAKHVVLAWSGTAPAWTVERKSGAAQFQKLASPNSPTYDDTSISADATYTYRVRPGDDGAPSNEVTVGPPPSGANKVAPAPPDAVADHYGIASAIALDENGDPAIAFVWSDPNKDDDRSDTELRFVRWDRATYRWIPAVKVAVVGEIETGAVPVALAVSPSDGTMALAYPIAATHGLTVAFSSDHGATWKPVAYTKGDAQTFSTAMSYQAGHLQIVANIPDDGPVLIDADGTDASKWKSMPVPAGGREHNPHWQVGLAYDAQSKPLVAFYDHAPGDDDTFNFYTWRPGDSAAHLAVDTHHHTSDNSGLALTFGSGHFGMVVAAMMVDNNDSFGLWYSSSSDGTSWSTPVKLPVDGPRSSNSPVDIAIDSHNRHAVAFGSNSGSGGAPCGYPELATSSDGATWKTCGLGRQIGAIGDPLPPTIHILLGHNDKLNVLWQLSTDNKYGRGLLLWRQP